MNKPELPDFLNNIRIVLARPSHPGNIGSAARAMKTMGLHQLYLVSPKTFPSEDANILASGAVDVLENAIVVDSLQEALDGTVIACGLTSRKRELTIELKTPRDLTPEILAFAQKGEKVALVFGNETFGLSIEELDLCNRLMTISGNPNYFSLNLAMAVQVTTYELFSQIDFSLDYLKTEVEEAKHEEVEGMCAHLNDTMQKLGYFERRNGERINRRMKALFHRAHVQKEEIDILRGFFKQAQRKAGCLD